MKKHKHTLGNLVFIIFGIFSLILGWNLRVILITSLIFFVLTTLLFWNTTELKKTNGVDETEWK